MSPAMIQPPPEERSAQREEMLGICIQCHSRRFSERELSAGDMILEQSKALVKEAAGIIRDLSDRDLLVPSLRDRPVHPLRGRELVLDGQMLYEDISHVERLFFKMKKYDLAKTVKGAFHQNPAYTHWYGNAELKMTLADIKAEAARLHAGVATRDLKVQKEEDQSLYLSVEKELQILKRKYDRGAITAAQYREGKQELLEQLQEK
jgi:hypothetical protein